MESNRFIKSSELTWMPVGEGITRHILAYNDDLMMVEVKFEKGITADLHSHVHTQVSYIASGTFEFTVSGEKQIVTQGDSILMKSNEPHQCRCIEEGVVIDTFTPMRVDFIK